MSKKHDYKKIYNEDYFSGKTSFFYRQGYGNFNQKFFYDRLYSPLKKYIAKKQKARVLDIGCAYGFILERFPQTYEKFGLDISNYAISKAKKRVPNGIFKIADAQKKFDFKKNYFDFVIANDVLEHLEKPEAALSNIYTILKDDGILYINTPNLNFIRKTVYHYADKMEHHISLFSHKDLLDIIEKKQFEVLDHWTFLLSAVYRLKFNLGTDSAYICRKKKIS